ncbi:MAG: Pyrophosphatase PpaX [Candidatus Celerinatantimonas neptuna]|nr:MAG: Pyrophosphatase PpaX [Candidatus Celerinatantimonas neptuna]
MGGLTYWRNKIEALGLSEFFDVVVTSGELSVKKPDPIIFNKALERLNADASDAVFIGDNLRVDMEPAKKLGMRTVWVNSKETDIPSYVDFRLKSYSEFTEIWQAITRR